MSTVDLAALVLLVVLVVPLVVIIVRQRQMLRRAGGIPLLLRHGNRWLYGVGRYDGGELKWFHAIGIGTRPTVVLRRHDTTVLSRRAPEPAELKLIPPTAIIVQLQTASGKLTLALMDGADTGFISWLEASARRI